MEAVIDTNMNKSVMFHGILNGFRAGRATGKVIMEINIVQELEFFYQYPLFLVFLEHQKDYGNLDHGRLLQTFEGYRAGTKTRGILAEF